MGWDQKEFSWRQLVAATAEVSGETTNDGELPERRCFAGVIKIPLPDFEQAIADQQFAFRFDQSRLHIFEIDTLNRLLNVQVPLRAGRLIGAVPIEGPVSRIAVLLDFDQQIACAYRMNTACREKMALPSSTSILWIRLITVPLRSPFSNLSRVIGPRNPTNSSAPGSAATTYQNSLFGSPPSLLATFPGG